MIASNEDTDQSLRRLLFGDGTLRKALLTALVVGTILTIINHGDVLLAEGMPPLWKVLLTYCVPYCVTTWGAFTGKRAQIRRRHSERNLAVDK